MLPRAQPWEQAANVRDEPGASLDTQGADTAGDPVKGEGSRSGRQDTAQHLHRGRLPTAVGAEQPDDLPGAGSQGQPLDDSSGTEGAGQVHQRQPCGWLGARPGAVRATLGSLDGRAHCRHPTRGRATNHAGALASRVPVGVPGGRADVNAAACLRCR